jgi:DNA-binding MarR family transcriptional regulator
MEDAEQDTHSDQTPPADLAEALVRAWRRLKNSERRELEPFGLAHAQARALRMLVDSGTMRIGDLADLLEIVPRSATTKVDGLEETGLVTRSMDPTDRRSILVTPTQEGHELIARVRAERSAAAEALFDPLSAGEKAELLRLLRAITKEA